MTPDVLLRMGSMLSRAITLAMGIVAVAAGVMMLYEALRLYRSQEIRVTDRNANPAAPTSLIAPRGAWRFLYDTSGMESPAEESLMALDQPAADPRRKSAYANGR